MDSHKPRRRGGPHTPRTGGLIRLIYFHVYFCNSSLPYSARILPLKYNYQDVKNDGIHWNDKIASVKITFGRIPSFSLLKKNNDVLVTVKRENAEKM